MYLSTVAYAPNQPYLPFRSIMSNFGWCNVRQIKTCPFKLKLIESVSTSDTVFLNNPKPNIFEMEYHENVVKKNQLLVFLFRFVDMFLIMYCSEGQIGPSVRSSRNSEIILYFTIQYFSAIAS